MNRKGDLSSTQGHVNEGLRKENPPTLINVTQQGNVLSPTADLVLKNKHLKKKMKIKVLFDNGSQGTYISEKASNFLKLKN